MQPLRLALIGAGQRGIDVYGRYALEHDPGVEFVAVAEPVAARRARFAGQHDLPPEAQFSSWEALLDGPRRADAVIVATQDTQHIAPALAALEAGYDVLLEKPMATTLADCVALVQAADRAGRLLQICHVLRYTDFFTRVHDLVQEGRLGTVVTYQHRENVAYYHMAHSFVRGNWRRADESSPMILAKSCHDLDLIYWILGEPVTRLSSVGTLRHFHPDQAPHPDVPPRCTDGCPVEAECPFFAPGIYLDYRPWQPMARAMGLPEGFDLGQILDWPMSALADGDLRPESIRRALETGPYGRCVYHCDNDVVDHQIVTMQTAAGTSVGFFMHGHSHEEGRTLRIDGTRATLEGEFMQLRQEIRVHDHLTGATEILHPEMTVGGHGGGDTGLMAAFVAALRGGGQAPLTDARAALESHLLAFAAEQARVEGTVIDMDAYRAAALAGTQVR
ncbi:MAG: Gfo/Idh/MocA family oxidoreductase [Anaerolineae bacterium]|nr:Gfo/Idh/MocA family oxidoreductase [Anaerolineae bacterium]